MLVTLVFKLMYSATDIFVTEHDQQVLTKERSKTHTHTHTHTLSLCMCVYYC